MSIYPKVSIDSLIDENINHLDEMPEDAKYANLNYGLRTVMGYLVNHYEDMPDITYACDHLAKLIAQLET